MNDIALVDIFQALKALGQFDPKTQPREYADAAVRLHETVYGHGETFESVGRHLSIQTTTSDQPRVNTMDWRDKARRCAAAPKGVLFDKELTFLLSAIDRGSISVKQEAWLDKIYKRLQRHDTPILAKKSQNAWRTAGRARSTSPLKTPRS